MAVETTDLPKICVILGAGASHDVAGPGAPVKMKDFKPPLAHELFHEIRQKDHYWRVLSRYPGAAFIAQSLATKSALVEFNLESELRRLSRHRDPQTRQNFKQVPGYLRDLIHLASVSYVESPTNYEVLISELIAENPHDVLFLVLNYDTLLETALTSYDPKTFQFNAMKDYVNPDRGATILKLHGSTNWFKKMKLSDKRTWTDVVIDFDPLLRTPDEEIVIQDNVNSVMGMLVEGTRFYPVLTAPLAGKGMMDIVAPGSHVASVKSFLKSCHKFLIVGTSGLDDDLLALLDSTLHPEQKNYVRVVGKGDGAGEAYAHFHGGVRSFRSAVPSLFHGVYERGFSHYVASEELQKFLSIQP